MKYSMTLAIVLAEWEYAAKGGKDVKWFPWGIHYIRNVLTIGIKENHFWQV